MALFSNNCILASSSRVVRRQMHIPFLFPFLLPYPSILCNVHSFVYLFSEQLLRAPLHLTNYSFLGAYESNMITDDWSYFKFRSTTFKWVLLGVSGVPWLGDNHLLPVSLHMSSLCSCPLLCPNCPFL